MNFWAINCIHASHGDLHVWSNVQITNWTTTRLPKPSWFSDRQTSQLIYFMADTLPTNLATKKKQFNWLTGWFPQQPTFDLMANCLSVYIIVDYVVQIHNVVLVYLPSCMITCLTNILTQCATFRLLTWRPNKLTPTFILSTPWRPHTTFCLSDYLDFLTSLIPEWPTVQNTWDSSQIINHQTNKIPECLITNCTTPILDGGQSDNHIVCLTNWITDDQPRRLTSKLYWLSVSLIDCLTVC